MLLLTVILLIVLFLISYSIFDKDLFAPPTVVCITFVFSALCALYNETAWGLDFSIETTMVILTGIGTFLVGGIVGVFLANGRNLGRFSFSHKVYPAQFIEINKVKLLAVIAFQLIILFMLYRHMNQTVGFIGLSWSEIMSIYRKQSMHMLGNDMTMRMSWLMRQFLLLSSDVSMIFCYIVGNNLAAKKKFSFLYWVPVLLGMVQILMQGYRGGAIRLWIITLVVWYTTQRRSDGWRFSKEASRMIRRMAISVFVVLIMFAATRELVGRTGSANEWSTLDYVTFYGGCPIAALDQYLRDPFDNNPYNIWGKETFYFLNQNILAWRGMREQRSFFAERGWAVTNNGTVVGNVYTAMRQPIEDFGYIGLPIVMSIMGSFYVFFYCKTRKKQGTGKIDFSLLVYAYCAHSFFVYFFSTYYLFISTTFIKELIFWKISLWFLMNNFSFTKRTRESLIRRNA